MDHQHVMPWWMGYLKIAPWRKLKEHPEKLVGPYVQKGMTVLDLGCGMGFFTLPMARLVGPRGRVVAVDLQRRMLASLERRARWACLSERITPVLCAADSLGLDTFRGTAGFALAFNVVHEVPDIKGFFVQVREVLASGGQLLVVEPPGHVSAEDFRSTLALAIESGFVVIGRPPLHGRTDLSALLG